MTQNDLNRAVADVTGETVTEIHRRGFQPHDPLDTGEEPLVIDWDTPTLVADEVTEPPRHKPASAPLSEVLA